MTPTKALEFINAIKSKGIEEEVWAWKKNHNKVSSEEEKEEGINGGTGLTF